MNLDGRKALLRSPTQELVAEGVIQHIVTEELAVGARINEQALARQLGVSRSPVRAVLAYLADRGILERRSRQGFILARHPDSLAAADDKAEQGGCDLYQRMMIDILLGGLARTVSQSALMRRYRVGRHELLVTLRRMTREGLAEPAAGRGWTFVRFDADVIEKGYDVRLILEPEVMLRPDYAPDRAQLERLQRDHHAVLAALSAATPWTLLFDLDARFHETLAEGSGNDFVVEVIRKQNRIRRLCEYLGYERLDRVQASLREHLAILESLRDGDIQWASAQLRRHLEKSLKQSRDHFAQDIEDLRTGVRQLHLPAAVWDGKA